MIKKNAATAALSVGLFSSPISFLLRESVTWMKKSYLFSLIRYLNTEHIFVKFRKKHQLIMKENFLFENLILLDLEINNY
jgi:hypothetical protein